MSKKILFFDIDGTLWNYKNEIPDSTREAIRKARQNGHMAFINSGRSRGFIINEELLDIGFDGIVSGCGSMIEYHGDTIFENRIDEDHAIRVVEGVRRYGLKPILEGKKYLYMDNEDFAGDWYGDKLKRELGDRLISIRDNWGRWDIQKLSCDCAEGDLEGFMKEFKDEFDYIIHNVRVTEMVPDGLSKGTGVEQVCRYLDIPLSDSIAFGDSINDKAMLLTAGTGIVMGSGTEEAKALADHITGPQEGDGIWEACKKMGLI